MVFTICVLNLFMAVYSNEYDQKQEQSSQLFYQERAKIGFECLLQPHWPPAADNWPHCHRILEQIQTSEWMLSLPQPLRERDSLMKLMVAGVAVILAALTCIFSATACPCCAAVALVCLKVFLQTFTLRNSCLSPAQGERFFLWICYSQQAYNVPDTACHTYEDLQAEVERLRKIMEDSQVQPGISRSGSQGQPGISRNASLRRSLAASTEIVSS